LYLAQALGLTQRRCGSLFIGRWSITCESDLRE
jgi:hypothetical protein